MFEEWTMVCLSFKWDRCLKSEQWFVLVLNVIDVWRVNNGFNWRCVKVFCMIYHLYQSWNIRNSIVYVWFLLFFPKNLMRTEAWQSVVSKVLVVVHKYFVKFLRLINSDRIFLRLIWKPIVLPLKERTPTSCCFVQQHCI